jgi:hypothetical protein
VAHSPSPFRRCLVLASATILNLLVLAATGEARARCKFGQIYRPSLGICQSKMARGAQPYLKRATRVSPAVRGRTRAAEQPRLKEPKARNHSEPLSSIPMLEPKAQGSLNPLPRWKSGL